MQTPKKKYSTKKELGQLRTIKQSELDASCWGIQLWGKEHCQECEYNNTPDCGGNRGNTKLIREDKRQVKSKVLRHKVDYSDKLAEFYQGEIPDDILKAGKAFVKIRVSDWRGEQDLGVAVKDVGDYYYYWARNIISGCRTLAGYAGDWRPIHRLAKECLEWFKSVNIESLKREGRKHGITLKE